MINKKSPDSRLQEQLVRSYLNDSFLLNSVDLHVCETLGSTNDYVMSRSDTFGTGYLACVANHQTEGRGRNGRQWQSPAGSNIYLSIGCSFTGQNLSSLSGLSLACGVSIASVLNRLGVRLQLKWPNDILVSEKKLAGILIETRIKGSSVFVVVGLGLNVDMSDVEAQDIDQPWTDLKSSMPIENGSVDNNWLVSQLIIAIVSACNTFQQTGIQPFIEDWLKYDILIGKEVWVCAGEREVLARVIGINEDCSLKVEMEESQEDVYAADVKIKLKT